jgi:spore germination protein KC
MRKRLTRLAVLVAVSLLLTGCFGGKETDDVAYVLIMGFDKAEGGQKVTYQIAKPKGVGSGESGGSDPSGMGGKGGSEGGKPWIINTLIIPSPADARMILQSTMSRTPNFSHVSVFIIAEEVAREGFLPTLTFALRNRDYRESLFILIVQGSAEEFIKNNNPRLESTVSKYYETFFARAPDVGYFMRTTLHEFYTTLKNPGGSPYAAYGGLNPKDLQNRPAGPKTTPEQKGDPYLPGGMPRQGTENPVEWLGLAVFRNDKMVGVLNSDETRAVALLQNKLKNALVGVVDPLKPEKDIISLIIRNGAEPKITADMNGGHPIFTVNIQIDAEIQGLTSGINYESPPYREQLETQIAKMLEGQILRMIKHTQELGTDPVAFGLYLRPLFSNYDELEKANLTTLYQAAMVQVKVVAKIRRTGLLLHTSPMRPE